jgi:hypothetical protein
VTEFERISRRLTTLELTAGDDDARFVRTYSTRGLHTVIDEYGLDAKLRALGLSDYRLVVTEDDAFRHRLELVLPGGEHVMDLRLHLAHARIPNASERADVVIVEWLLMQNPRAAFSSAKPRLPGQRHPGTGLGRAVAELLAIMCRRIGRDGLVVVPERFHLAELYAQAGWIAPSPEAERDLADVLRATPSLTFAARAWAVERGFVVDEDGAAFVHRPSERVLAVSPRMKEALAPDGFLWLRRLVGAEARFTVDIAALRASLVADPVEGMDPDALVV